MATRRRLTARLRAVALETLYRRYRISHPLGRTDNGGRWLPSDAERCDCCDGIREPSRSWPYSLMTHCRTADHMARSSGYTTTLIRWAMKRIESDWDQAGLDNNVQSIRDYETERA